MKRVIVTGATGFVGANLVRRLLRKGHKIHILVRPVYKSWRIHALLPRLSLHPVDLQDSKGVARAVTKVRPDWIFHLAVYGAYPAQTDLQRMVQTNIMGTVHLVEACAKTGFEAFINTGTSSEYGMKGHAPAETERLEPNSPYALTKTFTTLFCRSTARRFQLNMPTLRLYSVYGPYEEPTRLMPTLIILGLKGKLPPLVSPEIAHDFVYVDDVVEAYVRAAERNRQEAGGVYNVGTGIQVSIRRAVDIAQRRLGIKARPKWRTMDNRMGDTDTWVADNRLIRKVFGWRPQYTFEEGFRKMVAWFKENPEMIKLYSSEPSHRNLRRT